MLSINKVLNRVIVAQFYQQNSGLFLFIFFVMFGMVEGSQLINYHVSLMTGIIQSTAFLLIVFCSWILYIVKAIHFVTSTLGKPQNLFLFVLTSLSPTKQFLCLFLAHSLVHIPVGLYSIATVLVAFKQGHPLIGVLIIGFNIMLCSLASLVSVYMLNNPSSFYISPFIKIKFPKRKTLIWFYFSFILNDVKLIFLVTKVFSYFVLLGFFQIPLDHYENRIALMGLLIGITAHAVLIFEIRKWEDSYMSFTKNLPLTVAKRYIVLAFVYLVLIAPELFLLIMNKVHLLDLIGTIVFGVGLLLFLQSLLYRLSMDMDKYIQYVLIVFLLSFALLLFKLYLILVLIYLIVSFQWYKKYFYTYESFRL